jgi:hypothetical protein
MTYEEFLAQTDIAALDDQAATDAAIAYTVTELVKINTDTRKTAIETVDIFNGTVDRLKTFTPNPALTSEQQAIASSLAPKIVKAFDKLMNTQFYINLNDADVAMAFTAAKAYGVLTEVEYAGIYKAAESITKPFASKTLLDTKAVRYPATWAACAHPSDGRLLSLSNQDVITLSATLVDLVPRITVRCYWTTAIGQQEFLSNRTVSVDGADALYVSQSFKRADFGLPTTARVLRFEYTSIYDGVVASVSVSK